MLRYPMCTLLGGQEQADWCLRICVAYLSRRLRFSPTKWDVRDSNPHLGLTPPFAALFPQANVP